MFIFFYEMRAPPNFCYCDNRKIKYNQIVKELFGAVFFYTKINFAFLPEIWDALRAAADSDLALAQTIVDSAGIIVSNSDMTLCYDERGIFYTYNDLV